MTTRIEVLELQEALNICRKERALSNSVITTNYKVIDLEQAMDNLINRLSLNPPSLLSRIVDTIKICFSIILIEKKLLKQNQ